ncbi:MAG: DEAD/DEAH box helicase [Phycisphaeraceae bacterium]|nr:DEAD/DEAH box helicase [Phycisphaeraceae bacterium]
MGFKPFEIDHAARVKDVDPIEIFDSLTLRGSVNNLWTPQSTALASWHLVRSKPDVSIEMNTGGGKTLVGLLVSLSLARELGKMVLFVSPNIQLIQQTADKARECGIDVATYYDGQFTDEAVAAAATGPCLTTHHALFNGKSIFRLRDLGAIVLDDAHAAGGIIRDCFTLKLPRTSALFSAIAELFRPYFKRASAEITFDEVLAGRARDLLFVPLFESSRQAGVVLDKLVNGAVGEVKETKFAWAHIKEHLDRCVILIGHNGLEIAPSCLPTEQTPLFQKGLRRVYLTATLPSPIEFHRTFGIVPHAIKPPGRSGEAQRVFLSAAGATDEEQRANAKELVKARKTLILSPSIPQAQEWVDVASLFDKNDDNDRIEVFKAAGPPQKLVLAARYDGLDLPGDACRVMVLDGLPRGEALLNRYINETLAIQSIRAASTAIRVVQAVGRIFRSNTDHGAVVLVGATLQRWLATPFNRAFLPPLLQQQLDLATEIAKHIQAGDFTAADVLNDLLAGTKEWDTFYTDNIGRFATKAPQSPPEWLTGAIQAERAAHHAMWTGDYPAAAEGYAQVANRTREHDPDLAAWNRHFEGYCFERAGKPELAEQAFVAAANQRASLGRSKPAAGVTLRARPGSATDQAVNIARLMSRKGAQTLARAKGIPGDLMFENSTARIEQALCDLGELLGLDSSRPDKKLKIGPDVLWLAPDASSGHGLEAKTDKGPGSRYGKDDVGQAHNHRQWLKSTYKKTPVGLSWIGRTLPVTTASSPDDDLTVIDLGAVAELAGRVRRMYETISAGTADADSVQAWLVHLGLVFPECVTALPMRLATDLRGGEDD